LCTYEDYTAPGSFGHYSSSYDGKKQHFGRIKFGPTADYDRMDYGIVLKAGYTFTNKLNAIVTMTNEQQQKLKAMR
jgi:hypothetical protein